MGSGIPARASVLVRSLLLVPLLWLGACAQVVHYTDQITDARYGRAWFTRLPATVGGTVGFVLGVPVDILAIPVSTVVYRSQARETRDPLSVFLFPSFVLWKACALFGAPFDLVEWVAWRSWQPARTASQEEREAIERVWDKAGWSEYPVQPIYPSDGATTQPR